MSAIYKSTLDMIGNTPLLEPVRLQKTASIKSKTSIKIRIF